MTVDMRRFALLSGVAAQAGGVLWFLQWSHALVAHGPTSVDRLALWLGMTWFDSGKFLAVPLLLLIPGVLFIRRHAAGRRATEFLGVAVVAALVAAALGTALEFGLYEWGSYEQPTGTLAAVAGPFGALARGLLLPLAWLALGWSAVRAGAMPVWLVVTLVLGSVAAFFVAGPLPPVPGLAWLVFGAWLLTRRAAGDRTSAASAQH